MGGEIGRSLVAAAPWMEQALLIGVASARFAFAFLMLPLFSPSVIPPLVRNSVIVAFGLVALSLPIRFDPTTLSSGQWLWLYAREAAAGVTIGFFFGSFLWAMASAGEIIDNKTGATIAQVIDPLSGVSQPLTGLLLGRFAQVVFVTAGGLTLLVGTIMLSFAIWPMAPEGLALDLSSITVFEGEFGRFFLLAFVIASPALLILYVIDLGMGLLNRFAQNFNVFTLSLPIKAAAATFVTILILPALAQLVAGDLGSRATVTGKVMERAATPRENGLQR